jgi:hypothetical protein
VANICCSQVGVQVSTVTGIMPLSPTTAPFPTSLPPAGTPSPKVPLTVACQWVPTTNSTGQTEINNWLACAQGYGKTTTNTVCETPATLTSSGRTGRTQRGSMRWIGAMLLGGAVVQAVFAIQS